MLYRSKKIIALLLAVLTVFFAAACSESEQGEKQIEGKNAGEDLAMTAAADDIFTLNYNTSFSMNPLIATNTSNQLVCDMVYENMLELDNGYNVCPNVITEWSTSDGGQTWDFVVADNRVFHDGTKMTAADVAYSVKCAMNSDRFKSRFSYVYGCSAIDETTLRVTLGKQNMLFPTFMTVPVIKNGSFNEAYPQGTGPYTYSEDYTSLKAFSGYYDAKNIPIDTIYLKEYTAIDDIISAFEDSLLDVVMNDPTASPNIGYGSANEIRGYNTTNLHYIGFSAYSSIFSYDGLRYMMNYAFDREYLTSELLNGYGVPTPLVVSPASPYYSDSLASSYQFDLNTCQSYLTNAGYRDFDGDTYLEMPYGDSYMEVDISFLVCSSAAAKVNMARKFASDMASIGLKITVNALSWSAYKATLAAGNFDMYYAEVRMTPDFDPSRLLVYGNELNYGGVNDNDLNDAIAAYRSADNETDRAANCEAMCMYVSENAYIIPLCYEKHQMITHRGIITGITVSENNPFMNVTGWTINMQTVDESE